MKSNIHVVPRDGGWAERREGAQRDSSRYDAQSAAIDAAGHTAQREGTELLVHGRNGHDPYQPKG
jgi:hypothetical protein